MFIVFNKEKIYTYLISIVTVVLLFCVAGIFTNQKETYSIVSTYEADPFENKISNKSPLALSLMGKSKGDVVIVEAPTKYEVKILDIK